MIDMEQLVDVGIYTYNIQHYRSNGYDVKKDQKIKVKLKDVHDGFNGKVEVFCDGTGEKEIIKYQKYLKLVIDGKYYSKEYFKNLSTLKKVVLYYDKLIKFCNDNNYELITKITEIQTRDSYVKYICPIHGECITKLTSILQGKKCYHCSRITVVNKKWQYTADERQEKIYNQLIEKCNEKGYTLLTQKENIHTINDYIDYNCSIHGKHKMKVSNMIYDGRGCPDCNNEKRTPKSIKDCMNLPSIYPSNKLTADNIVQRVEECGGVLLNPLDYINQKTKNLQIECPECGQPFTTSFVNFIQHGGQLCDKCRKIKSTGEMIISNYLKNRDINYISEKWFDDCRDIKPLPFDFYLYELNCIIEYDGEHHYMPIFGEERFKLIQKHDKILIMKEIK